LDIAKQQCEVMSKIIERIEREAGVAGLASILAERLAPTDLLSLLLEVYRLRSGRLQPPAVLADYESNRFVRPSAGSPSQLLGWEQVAFSQLPSGFEPVALSPVCPLGTSSVVASVPQDWAVVTTRNTEVVSDSTNVLALECAVRRRQLLRSDPRCTERVHLAASHRLLRAQHYQSPHLLAHFSALALCSAGRDQGRLEFELDALGLHIRFYLRALRAYLGSSVPLRVSVTDFRNAREGLLETRLLSPLRSEFGAVDCMIDGQRTGGRGYYVNLCFHIHATAASGEAVELVDGGSVDWTKQLLSNAKERLVISGIGSERLCTVFGGADAD
jgi:hypothetical protein